MYTYLLLFIVFLIQEPVTTGAVLLDVYTKGANIWIIHLLFVVATILDIFVGYYAGLYIHNKLSENRIAKYAKRRAVSLTKMAGKHGHKVMLAVFGQIIFPITAFLTPWLGISLKDSFIYLFMGELLLWYVWEWILVLGVKSTFLDPHTALYSIVAVTLFVSIWSHFSSKNEL